MQKKEFNLELKKLYQNVEDIEKSKVPKDYDSVYQLSQDYKYFLRVFRELIPYGHHDCSTDIPMHLEKFREAKSKSRKESYLWDAFEDLRSDIDSLHDLYLLEIRRKEESL